MYILILLLLVAVIFKFLFNSFGNISEKDIDERNRILNNLSRMMNGNKSEEIVIKEVSVDHVDKNNDMSEKNEFINTSKKVIETVNLALSNNDEKTLSGLLTESLFAIFKKNIDENLKNNRVFKTIVVSFDKIDVFSINMKTMNVRVVMNQINYIQDNESNFISGDKSKIVKVMENWEFVRNSDKSSTIPWLINNISEYNA